MKKIFYIISIFMALQLQSQKKVIIRNDLPRLTNENKIVDAHDGRIIKFGDKYYWYGTQYGNTNGFTNANTYVSYSSLDLVTWKFEGKLLASRPDGVYYRPHVVYNAKNKKYILWYNWNPKLWDGQFGVAESEYPQGPFKIINNNVKVKHSNLKVGDLGVFIDDDAKAYLSYNTIEGHKVSVEALDEHYTSSTMQGSEFLAENCEAGSMFKKQRVYYLMTDYTCCFCTQGSGARVFTALNPLGPYTFKQNINRYAGIPSPLLNDKSIKDNTFETLQANEKNEVLANFSKATNISQLDIYQFTGNRNGQCGEVDNPILHQPIIEWQYELAYFNEGEWQKITSPKVQISNSTLQKKYSFTFPNIVAEKIKITPHYKDEASTMQIAEVDFKNIKVAYKLYKTNGRDGYPIIPAQQTYIMELVTSKGTEYIWMGDFWGSAIDGVKGKDFQYWSSPMKFYKNGMIKDLEWEDSWSVSLK
jgi:hypothetical protein